MHAQDVHTAVGDAMDIAVMLQRTAAPGTIVLSETTADQVVGYMRVEPVEPLPLPGRKGRLAVSRVIGVGPQRSPLEGLGARPLAPFVGRQRELATLGDVLSHVVLGHGQVVGIVGEPGMGKSRMLLEFRHSLRTSAVTYLEERCCRTPAPPPICPSWAWSDPTAGFRRLTTRRPLSNGCGPHCTRSVWTPTNICHS